MSIDLTRKQQNELECIKYFMDKDDKFNDEDIGMFFFYSECGIKPKAGTEGYESLLQGKRFRDIHVGMWEEGVLDGTVPYSDLFGEGAREEKDVPPKSVVEFMAKTMFQGIDYDIIMASYKGEFTKYLLRQGKYAKC